MSDTLFSPLDLGSLRLKNRMVRSATWEGMATDRGMVTDSLIELTRNLARGGIGLIITSQAYIREDGKSTFRQLGIHDESCVRGLACLADAAHEHSVPIFLQISHGGILADQVPVGKRIGPSAVQGATALTEEGLRNLAGAYGMAALRARAAGFDGIQLHSAHGHLLNQFLSPAHNLREDRYGGSIENRARFPLEVYQAVRNAVGKDYPVMWKLNAEDFTPEGIGLDDALAYCDILSLAGAAAIEMSDATSLDGAVEFRGEESASVLREHYREAAQRYKSLHTAPLIFVGGAQPHAGAEELVNQGVADALSLSHSLVRQPDLPSLWQKGQKGVCTCDACRACIDKDRAGDGARCVEQAALSKDTAEYDI